ncbi:hypothetical protein [Nocardioides perillae]|uniref:Uncharacterized protein n=1 Tax=Nocardioides perillae TaxID=1119534 RepID=A0A7Y9RUH2_9ACTN|nr:hypothetical protein [Nocardioides perillae]NYG55564.1 hypothetical protein [Nocardioides perillae]
MRLPTRRRPPAGLRGSPGERLLAWASASDGSGAAVGGTRDAVLVLPGEGDDVVRVPWEAVEAADWDADEGRLRVSEVGSWGEVRPVHVVALDDPDRLLQLVRERVTASVVLQRHVRLAGRRGVRVIARRAPAGGPLRWLYEYDEGVDPDDPDVRARAEAALAAALEEAGEAGRLGPPAAGPT